MKHVVVYLLLFFPLVIYSQTGMFHLDSISHRLEKQRKEFPQEKVHVLTDKPHYMGGDTLWFRAFVVDATSHETVRISRYLYAELRTPFDSLECRVKIKEHKGVYAGYMALPAQMPEGEYTLCAYTLFMESIGETYFFKKTLYVHSRFATQSFVNAQFEREDEQLLVKLSYTDKDSGRAKPYHQMIYSTSNGKTHLKREGKGEVLLRLDEKEARAGYLFVAFNNYKKYFRIPALSTDYTVSFHPEGGYLVPDVPCTVGFKAITSLGTSEPISGKLMNSKDEIIANIETLHAGMGLLIFIPRNGEHYHAVCRNSSGIEHRFPLPVVEPNANVLKISYPDKKSFTVSIQGSGQEKNGFCLLFHQRGKLLYSKQGFSNEKPIQLKRDNFSPGILQILLLDASGRTLSERMLFIRDYTSHPVTIKSEQKRYRSREKVKLDVLLENFKMIEGDYAVSVTDMSAIIPDTVYSIESNLLLSSELCGFIESPAYYFNHESPYVEQSLDALLLTQGWRRYDIPSVLQGRYSAPSGYVEIGQELTGRVASTLLNKPVQNAMVKVIAPEVRYADIFQTDSLGQFYCNGFDFPDSTRFILEALNKSGKRVLNLKITPDHYPSTHFCPTYIQGQSSADPDFSFDHYINQEKRRSQYSAGIKSILLDEVTVVAVKRKASEDVFELLASRSYGENELEEMQATSIDEVVRRIPGIRIAQRNPVFRQNIVAIYVDGVCNEPLVPEGTNPREVISTPYEELQLYPFDMIKRIDFLKPNEAVLLGVRATGGGVLYITTKRGSELKWEQPLHLQCITPLGYQKAAEFYSPKYETTQQRNFQGYDLRNTLYWNPSIQWDKNGYSAIEFYTSDAHDTKYMVRLEGITAEGAVFHTNYLIEIE